MPKDVLCSDFKFYIVWMGFLGQIECLKNVQSSYKLICKIKGEKWI